MSFETDDEREFPLCRDQESLDTALAAGGSALICSPSDRILRAVTDDSMRIMVENQSRVDVWGQGTIDALGRCTVRAHGGTIWALGESDVSVSGPARVIARDRAVVRHTQEVQVEVESDLATVALVDALELDEPTSGDRPGPDKVTVYSLPGCSACHLTSVALDTAGVPHDVVRLDELDETERADVVQDAKQAPVVIAPGIGRWDGFRRDRIAQLGERYTTAGPAL